MGEYDVTPSAEADVLAEATERVKLAAVRKQWTRDQAVARGAELGRAEGERRNETGKDLEDRIARAKAYAAWEWDGKPAGGQHLREFGVARPELGLKALSGGDFKQGKTK